MNWKWFIFLLLIAFGLTLALGIAAPASASVVLNQGDTAYLGEYVDLSRVVAWPDYKLAWCSGDMYGCTPPDQVIAISGYMSNYYLDPGVWHTGTYYRWDGQWHRGENMEAFTILPGTRPAPTPTPTPNETTEVNTTPEALKEGPFTFLIARGDNPRLTFTSGRKDAAHLWMFGTTKQVIDLPMNKTGNDYYYQLNTSDTFSTDVGTYDGYLQFNGDNGLQDVYWNPVTQCIETPYRSSLQKDVCPNVWNPANVKQEFLNMIGTAYNSDDFLVPVKIQVKEPEIVVTELLRGSDTIWIQGQTTWSPGTILTLKLDPDNYATSQEIRLHTWTTIINGTMDTWRTFSISCDLNLDELSIGTHDFKMSVTKNRKTTEMFYTFRVSDTFIMPTPTPRVEKILLDAEGNKIVMTTTVVPTPTPRVSLTLSPGTYNTTSRTDVVEYVNGTLKNTTITPPTPTPPPMKVVTVTATTVTKPVPAQTTIPTIPVSPLIGMLAVAGVIAWRRLR